MSRVLPAQRVLPAARVVSAGRVLSRRPVLGVYTVAEPGETLIPHLYDWFFNCELVSQYLLTDTSIPPSPYFTVFASVAKAPIVALPPPYDAWIYRHEAGAAFYGSSSARASPGTSAGFTVTNQAWGATHVSITAFSEVYRFVELAFVFSEPNMYAYRNGVLAGSGAIVGNILNVPGKIRVGGFVSYPLLRLYIGYIVYYHSLVDVTAQMNRSLPYQNMKLFLDATYFDVSKYIDLSGNNNHGYPYGGAARVPASTTWLWRVRDLYSGDKVRVLVPPMTRYKVGLGGWQVNDTWRVVELFLDPGLISLVFEGL